MIYFLMRSISRIPFPFKLGCNIILVTDLRLNFYLALLLIHRIKLSYINDGWHIYCLLNFIIIEISILYIDFTFFLYLKDFRLSLRIVGCFKVLRSENLPLVYEVLEMLEFFGIVWAIKIILILWMLEIC